MKLTMTLGAVLSVAFAANTAEAQFRAPVGQPPPQANEPPTANSPRLGATMDKQKWTSSWRSTLRMNHPRLGCTPRMWERGRATQAATPNPEGFCECGRARLRQIGSKAELEHRRGRTKPPRPGHNPGVSDDRVGETKCDNSTTTRWPGRPFTVRRWKIRRRGWQCCEERLRPEP